MFVIAEKDLDVFQIGLHLLKKHLHLLKKYQHVFYYTPVHSVNKPSIFSEQAYPVRFIFVECIGNMRRKYREHTSNVLETYVECIGNICRMYWEHTSKVSGT